MSVSSELTKLNTNMQNAYTAVSNKGGTLPASQNMDNLATAINSISGGGGGYTELPSYQVSNGVASRRSATLTGNEFSNITQIGPWGMLTAFNGCDGLIGVLGLSSLTSIDFHGMDSAFTDCTGLTGVDLSSLTSIGNYGMLSTFENTGLTSVDFPALTSIGRYGMKNAFAFCFELTDIYFWALDTTSFGSYTNQFDGMLSDLPSVTLHFPENLEETISQLTGYPTFGGGDVVCEFDLPATS